MKEEEYIKDFAKMPLEKKIANLVKLEAMALGDTLTYIGNAPYVVFDKVLDVMAGFGLKMHEEEKAAMRPEEHIKENGNENGEKAAEATVQEPEVPSVDDIIEPEIPEEKA